MDHDRASTELEVERLGFTWRLPRESCITKAIVEQGAWEPETTRSLARLVRPGMTVLDVGANVGWFTTILARLVGPNGRVVACEPVAHYREFLVANLERNGLAARVTVLPFGLSDAEAERTIVLGEASATLHGICEAPDAARERIRLRPFDQVAQELGLARLDFAKVDIDGHEPAFLRGARATLRRLRPVLSIEFAAHCLHVAGSDVRTQAALLTEAGYALCDETTGAPYESELHFLVACGNFDKSANALAVPLEHVAGVRTKVVPSLAELQEGLACPLPGKLLETDLDVVETDCDWYERKRRDAEVLCTLAANVTGDCLELGTSHGRGTFKLASNLGARGVVHTVNLLPEQLTPGEAQITHLLTRGEIGSFVREHGDLPFVQHYANTARWSPPAALDRLALAFVDACHDEEAVLRDSRLAWERLAPGGFLVWHDWSPFQRARHPWIDSVMRGVERFVRELGIDQPVWHLRHSWIGVLRKPGVAVLTPTPRAPEGSAGAKALRFLWTFSEYSPERTREEQAFCARMRASGWDVQAMGIPCPGGWWPFPKLDAAWRAADPGLLAGYHALESALVGRDVLVSADGAMLHPEFVASLRAFTVFCCADDPESSEVLSRPAAPAFDHAFVLNHECLDQYRAWGCEHVDPLLRPYRPELCAPDLDVARILTETRDLDIVMFCERVYGVSDRAARIEALLRAFPNAHVRGKGWPGGFVSDSEMRATYRRARIGWNLHNSSGAFNTRLVTLPAFGVLQICDNKSALAKVFELGKEAVGFDTIEEAVELTRYYLAHERERREIAAAGFAKVVRDHTEERMFAAIATRVATRIAAKPARPELVSR